MSQSFTEQLFESLQIKPEQIDEKHKPLVFDQRLVLTETTRKNLEKILYPVLEKRNVLLVGDAGIGKNALVYYLNKMRNLPTIRFSFNQDTLPEDLAGSFRVLPDGFHWSDGPLVQAMREGFTFVADEMNLASPEILKRFISVFDRRNLNLLEKDATEIAAHDRFHFIATQNPARGFEGRKNLPESISRLFTLVHLEKYPVDEEIEIMTGLFSEIDSSLLQVMVYLQRKLEAAVWHGDLAKDDLEHYHFNIRTAERFWGRFYENQKLKVKPDINEDYFLAQLAAFYIDTFRHEADREAAIAISAEALQVNPNELRARFQQIAENRPSKTFLTKIETWSESTPTITETSLDVLPMTQNRISSLEQMHQSLENNENLLLEGEEAVRMNELVSKLAEVENKAVRSIYLARGMHTSDIIGALRPVSGNHNSAGSGSANVAWVDGPLTAGLKNEEWVILDNIEAAGSELIEKLNMLLDHAATLAMPPEAGAGVTIKKQGKARIIALKRVRKSRNQPTISRAFRNRFFNMHLPAMNDQDELAESAGLYWHTLFEKNEELDELLDKILFFHAKLSEAAGLKKIGKSLTTPIVFREENLLRFISHIDTFMNRNRSLSQTLESGLQVHYLSMIPEMPDRAWALDLWQRISRGLPLENLEKTMRSVKKKLSNQSHQKKMYWDPEKHFRQAHTGKAKPRLSGKPLKKGLRINTPETGGQIKEGPDAWYGQDTQGNMGVGEPVGGGGAWGYKTEALFEQFLKKYKPKWDYNMGFVLRDFYDVFGKMLEDLELDLENALESQTHIERKLASTGNRVDARRYINYMAHNGSDRIFDHSKIIHTEDKLKGLEFAFLINKGRRIFNFEYSVASVVALQSALEVLWDKKVTSRVFGYSDFDNMKRGIDLVEYTRGFSFEQPEQSDKEKVFDQITNGWEGDTVEEAQVLQNMDVFFSPEASTRVVVIISDFRGHRARARIEDEVSSYENMAFKQLIETYSAHEYVFLGLQTGTRYIAEHLMNHSIWVNAENFDKAPLVLAEKLQKLILKYHKAAI